MADDMITPDKWTQLLPEAPHDHKGHSEEKCVRCGWVMGDRPLNCMNDDTPHVFPSQQVEIERLRRFKKEATEVLAAWEAVFDALIDISPADLGVSKPTLVAKEIIRLRAEVARLELYLQPIIERIHHE